MLKGLIMFYFHDIQHIDKKPKIENVEMSLELGRFLKIYSSHLSF